MQRAIQAQEQIIQTTTELFKTMSHQLITAQIRVANRGGVEKYYGGDRGITDGNPYQLPENWDESSIGDVTVKAKQRDPRKTPNEEFQYVDVSSTSRELFKIKNTTPTMGSDAPSRARNTIEKDDVIFATVRPTLQRIAVIPPSLDGQIASTGYCVLRCDKNKAYPDFLYLFLITDHFTARMAGLERGANYPAVRNSDVKNSWLPLPPLPEQKKIAHILSTVQRAIQAQEKIIQTTTELFKSMLHQLMTAQIRVTNDDGAKRSCEKGQRVNASFKNLDTNALPPGWSADFFGNLVDYKLGKTPPRGNSIYWENGKYPWVSISDMTPHGVVTDTAEKVSQEAYDDALKGKFIPKGSLLMSFKLTIGRISQLGIAAFHNEAIISFQPNPKTLNADYLRYYLSQINYKNYQDTAIKGQTLNRSKLNALEIALPPLPEQKKIAHILSAIQQKTDNAQSKKSKLETLFRILLHELMTAKTRVSSVGLIST